jgi:hypothetical protein
VVLALSIGLLLILLFFPAWRAIAVRSPELATEGNPELLDEIQRDMPMHPSEPNSNVHRMESE